MLYKWLLEIVNLHTGEQRNLEYTGDLKDLFNYLKKLEKNQWELMKIEKKWIGGRKC